MRVIFITDSYYPSPSPNAICVKKLKDVFDEKEITTDIIAVRTFSKNTKLLRDNSIHFVNPDFLLKLKQLTILNVLVLFLNCLKFGELFMDYSGR